MKSEIVETTGNRSPRASSVPADLLLEDRAHGASHLEDALQVFFLLPGLHEKERFAEPQNQAARRPQTPDLSHQCQRVLSRLKFTVPGFHACREKLRSCLCASCFGHQALSQNGLEDAG